MVKELLYRQEKETNGMKNTLRIIGTAVIIALAVSVVIPATAEANPLAGQEGSGGMDGKEVFMAAKCNMCHAVSTVGIEAKVKSEKMKGPDLVNSTRDAATLKGYLKGETEMNGAKHKKPFKGSDEELQAIIDWLLEQKS